MVEGGERGGGAGGGGVLGVLGECMSSDHMERLLLS